MLRSRISIRSTTLRDGGRIVRPTPPTNKIPRPGMWVTSSSAKWHGGKKMNGKSNFFWSSKNPYSSCCCTNIAKVSKSVTSTWPAMWTHRRPHFWILDMSLNSMTGSWRMWQMPLWNLWWTLCVHRKLVLEVPCIPPMTMRKRTICWRWKRAMSESIWCSWLKKAMK